MTKAENKTNQSINLFNMNMHIDPMSVETASQSPTKSL